ncbi:hypothetical protein GA0115240_15346, partial [Streptomyces sp. DvalAA-14]
MSNISQFQHLPAPVSPAQAAAGRQRLRAV